MLRSVSYLLCLCTRCDDADIWRKQVCESSFVLFFATTEETMLGRLLERGKTSGRADDNRESIVKRFRESLVSEPKAYAQNI
jgi:UMP-CMP kinase